MRARTDGTVSYQGISILDSLLSLVPSELNKNLPTLTCTGIELLCCCLFLTFSALVANPKKLLYTVANPARSLLNRGKKQNKTSGSARPPRALLVRRK